MEQGRLVRLRRLRDPRGRGANLLRILFRPGGHDHLLDWESVAQAILGTVRREILRVGMNARTEQLIEEMSASSPEFRRMWAEQDVREHGEGLKRIRHPKAGIIALEYSTFGVDGRPDLSLVVFNPANEESRDKVRRLIHAAG